MVKTPDNTAGRVSPSSVPNLGINFDNFTTLLLPYGNEPPSTFSALWYPTLQYQKCTMVATPIVPKLPYGSTRVNCVSEFKCNWFYCVSIIKLLLFLGTQYNSKINPCRTIRHFWYKGGRYHCALLVLQGWIPQCNKGTRAFVTIG